jgi:ATP-dependent helicase/nuclease subunit A
MTRELGELDYGENESLLPPPDASRTEDAFRLWLVESGEEDRLEAEAEAIAAEIESLLASGFKVTEGGAERPLEEGDIAILLRSVKDRDSVYAAALAKRGIASVAQKSSASLLERREIVWALSLLEIIDNPLQDIPLIAALRSPVWGFSPTSWRIYAARIKNAFFYEALKKAALKNKKCAIFSPSLRLTSAGF